MLSSPAHRPARVKFASSRRKVLEVESTTLSKAGRGRGTRAFLRLETNATMNDQVDSKLEEKLEAVSDFLSYEEYLDSQILPLDEYFLEDKELARELVQLGYRGGSQADTISREEFAELKKIQNDKKSFQKEAPKLLVSAMWRALVGVGVGAWWPFALWARTHRCL